MRGVCACVCERDREREREREREKGIIRFALIIIFLGFTLFYESTVQNNSNLGHSVPEQPRSVQF